MNPEQLVAHFGRISEAPDAVPRLRRFILDLAVRGKLVEQDPRDKPASALLSSRRLLAELKTQPWALPPGWAWSSFALLGETIGGGTPDKANSDFWDGPIPWVSPKDMKVDVVADAQDHISELALTRSPARLIPPRSLLMVVRGMILAHSFPVALSKVPVTINQDMKALVPFDLELAPILLLIAKGIKPEVMRLVRRSTHGTCALPSDDLFSLPLPIPPQAEQHRILAQVDELMALCDRLEAAQAERETRRDRLVAASLNRLAAGAGETQVLRDHARFHLRHLPRLTTRAEHIQQLRQTILNLSVQGRLVPQDSTEEPAPKLGVEENPEGGDRLRLRLPSGWSWARVEDVADVRLGKMLDQAKNSGRPYRYLRNTNVHWFTIRMDGLKSLRIEQAEAGKYLLRHGDVLICEGGHGIGRTAVWREAEEDIAFQKALHRVRPGPALSSDFFAYCMYAYFHARVLHTYFTGVGIPHFTSRALSTLVFPLPPLAEQFRIVAKVEELIALCDRLEAQVTTVQADGRRLLEAVFHQALAPNGEDSRRSIVAAN